MKFEKLFLALAIIAVTISVVSVGVVYFSIDSLVSQFSGYATSTGDANLTVESLAVINFTTSAIDWGSGRVNSGASSAQLTTFPTNNVTNGNWTLTTAGGLRIENLGNVNVSLNLTAGKSAASFFGGTSPGYQWNVSNVESNSCLNSSGSGSDTGLNVFSDTSTTTTLFCSTFQFKDSADTIRIDLNLTIPSDSQTGALSDTITATAIAI